MRRCTATWEVVGMEEGNESSRDGRVISWLVTMRRRHKWSADDLFQCVWQTVKCDVCVWGWDVLRNVLLIAAAEAFETYSRKRKSDRASQGAGVLPLRIWTHIKNVSLSWSIPEGETGHALLLCSIFVACVCCNLWPHPNRGSVISIAIGLL